jgi:hypothetical protein
MNIRRGAAALMIAALLTGATGTGMAMADDNPSKSDRGGNTEINDRGPDKHGPGHK